MKTDKELYDFCKGFYYSTFDQDGEEDCLWEPFENTPESMIETYIRQDKEHLKRFIGSDKGEWDEESNKGND